MFVLGGWLQCILNLRIISDPCLVFFSPLSISAHDATTPQIQECRLLHASGSPMIILLHEHFKPYVVDPALDSVQEKACFEAWLYDIQKMGLVASSSQVGKSTRVCCVVIKGYSLTHPFTDIAMCLSLL